MSASERGPIWTAAASCLNATPHISLSDCKRTPREAASFEIDQRAERSEWIARIPHRIRGYLRLFRQCVVRSVSSRDPAGMKFCGKCRTAARPDMPELLLGESPGILSSGRYPLLHHSRYHDSVNLAHGANRFLRRLSNSHPTDSDSAVWKLTRSRSYVPGRAGRKR